MQKTRKFPNSYFQVDILKKGIDVIITDKEPRGIFKIAKGFETLKFDDEREFYADYRKLPDTATIGISDRKRKTSINIEYIKDSHTNISVEGESRGEIEEVFEIFESKYKESIEKPLTPKKKPVIFIGHGGSSQWRELKDHLTDKHDYKIEAYETGSRAGHTIRDVLEDMSNKSSLAFLVMTGEDIKQDGTVMARPNVIHEVGLFQGKLGFSKAIVLLEKETEEFSNLYGIQQIRFSKDNIKETFGEVLATIKRELE
jgi:predicted nucleotide-binding protein